MQRDGCLTFLLIEEDAGEKIFFGIRYDILEQGKFVVPDPRAILYCKGHGRCLPSWTHSDGDGMDASIFYHALLCIASVPGVPCIPACSMASIKSICPKSCG